MMAKEAGALGQWLLKVDDFSDGAKVTRQKVRGDYLLGTNSLTAEERVFAASGLNYNICWFSFLDFISALARRSSSPHADIAPQIHSLLMSDIKLQRRLSSTGSVYPSFHSENLPNCVCECVKESPETPKTSPAQPNLSGKTKESSRINASAPLPAC